jgi:uncharacterized protein
VTFHPLDYVEIAVGDLTRAKDFYAAAFGWAFTDYGPEYAGIQGPDGEVGGLGVGRPPGPGGVMALLRSGDLDASLAAVQDAGGTMVEEPYDYPGGRRFICADPDGNVLGVYQPA